LEHRFLVLSYKFYNRLLIFLFLGMTFITGQPQPSPDSLSSDPLYHIGAWHALPIDDVGDIFDYSPNYQLFDFLDYGRPRYSAPLNMLPQQLEVYRDDWQQNDRLNGMYNSRLLSIDMINTLKPLALSPSAIQYKNRNNAPKEPFSRIRYWEGDYGSFDLSLLLSERLTPKTDLYLAGFNRGYDGFWSNSAYTGVKYDGRLVFYPDVKHTLIFSYGLNRQKSGMQNISAYPDYSRSNYRDYYGIEFKEQSDSSHGFSAGLHFTGVRRTVHSKPDSFELLHRYDQWRFYLQKNIQGQRQNWKLRFLINQTYVWGTAYSSPKSINRFWLNIQQHLKWSNHIDLRNIVSVIQENNHKVVYLLGSQLRHQSTDGRERLRAGFSFRQRLPDIAERYFNAYGFKGNATIRPEAIIDLYSAYSTRLARAFKLNGRMGYKQVKDEILLSGSGFKNGATRSWGYLQAGGSWKVWKLHLRGLGHMLLTKEMIAPQSAVTFALSYHDVWLKGALILDLSAMASWNGSANKMFFNPIVERFYWNDQKKASYRQYNLKAVATVDEARLYFMVENPFATNYHIIEGYNAYVRRIRFGINWDFWN